MKPPSTVVDSVQNGTMPIPSHGIVQEAVTRKVDDDGVRLLSPVARSRQREDTCIRVATQHTEGDGDSTARPVRTGPRGFIHKSVEGSDVDHVPGFHRHVQRVCRMRRPCARPDQKQQKQQRP